MPVPAPQPKRRPWRPGALNFAPKSIFLDAAPSLGLQGNPVLDFEDESIEVIGTDIGAAPGFADVVAQGDSQATAGTATHVSLDTAGRTVGAEQISVPGLAGDEVHIFRLGSRLEQEEKATEEDAGCVVLSPETAQKAQLMNAMVQVASPEPKHSHQAELQRETSIAKIAAPEPTRSEAVGKVADEQDLPGQEPLQSEGVGQVSDAGVISQASLSLVVDAGIDSVFCDLRSQEDADERGEIPGGPQAGPDLNAGMFRKHAMREVSRIQAALRQHADAGGECPKTLLRFLRELEIYVVDREVLARTSIGKQVNELKSSPLREVSQAADALLAQWKKDLRVRDQVVQGFSEKGSLKSREARELEEGLFNTTCPMGWLDGEDYASYQRHYKRLCTHLRVRGPGSLVERLSSGTLTTLHVAALPDSELMSTKQREQQQAEKQECLRNVMVGGDDDHRSVSDVFVCPKCQGARTSFQEVQTGWHGSGQDMTVVVSCMECGERWKENDDHGLAA